MELRSLKTFLRVAALQNFTKASQELGYSQSNVSAQIKQLEEEIGSPLFDRIGRNVYLNHYGEELIPYARQLVSIATHMENFLKPEESMYGTIKIGMAQSLIELLLEDAFLRYHRRFPLVRLELTVDATSTLKSLLQHGQLDMACLIDDPLSQTEWFVWDSVEVPVVLVSNPSHPLANQEFVTLVDLASQDLILMEESAPYSVHFKNLLARHHLEYKPFLKLQSAATARNLVERDSFLSVLPLYAVKASADAGHLRILNVPEWNQMQSVQLVLHKHKTITPQVTGFLEELRIVLGTALAENLSV